MPILDCAARRQTFRKLHDKGCFVIPNPWDFGSARYLRHLGFPALATSSAGFAFSCGLPDGAVPRDRMLAHIAEIVQSVDLPVNADFEAGYAVQPEAVAANVLLCVETGVAGLSIEDSTGDSERPLYELGLAVDRIRAAQAAIDGSASGVLLTARAECFLVGHPDPLRESIRRLQAFAEAGADVLYAPGPYRREDFQTIVHELSPKPVNVLVSRNVGLTVADLREMGVRRISVGSTLARVAWSGFMHSAQALARDGSFQSFEGLEPHAEINRFLREDLQERSS